MSSSRICFPFVQRYRQKWVSWRRSRRLNISAYPSENFAHVTILNNAETIRHLWKVDILEMGVSPGFCLSKACCLYADRLDDNRLALVGR